MILICSVKTSRLVVEFAGSLDIEYLSHWIDRLGLQRAWQRIRKSDT